VLFQAQGSLKYFLEVPLHWIANLCNRSTICNSGSLVKWRITVVICLKKGTKLLSCLPKQRALPPHNGGFCLDGHQHDILYFTCSKNLKRNRGSWWEASVCFNWAVSQSCGSVALANQQRGQLLSVESLDTQYKEYFKRIRKCCHTKLLWWINIMTNLKEGDFSSQPGWQKIMKFFSTFGFRIRSVFIQMGLWANGPYDFRGQGSLRTFTKRGVTDSKSLLGLSSPATVYSAQSFWTKQETLSDICIFSRMTSCCHLWQMACLCIHSGLWKMV